MGANYCEIDVRGTKEDVEQLRTDWAAIQDERSYDYGHDTYAGHLGIKAGLTIRPEEVETSQEAEDLCMDNDKWGPAEAVWVTASGGYWYIGGWCAS